MSKKYLWGLMLSLLIGITIAAYCQEAPVNNAGTEKNNTNPSSPAETRFGLRGLNDVADNPKALKLAVDAGVKWMRSEVSWEAIEPQKGQFKWNDNIVNVLACNVQYLPTLKCYSSWGAPKSSKESPSGADWIVRKASSYPEGHEKDYQNFVTNLVERYDGDEDFGPYPIDDKTKDIIRKNPIKYWQIENEPGKTKDTDSTFWNGTPEELVNLYLLNVEAIKKADPSAKIMLPGFTTGSLLVKGDKGFPVAFMQILQQKHGDFDIFDFHTYEELDTISEAANISKKLMDKYGFKNKEIWITEADINWHTVPDDVTEEQWNKLRQIDMVKRFVIAFGCDVAKVIKWIFRDAEEQWSLKPDSKAEDKHKGLMHHEGLVYHNLKPKPEYVTYTLMASKLEGFTSVKNLSKDDYQYYVFNFKNREPVGVLWSDKRTKLHLDNFMKNIKITDIDGKETSCENSDSIELTERPVFIESSEEGETWENE